ncbi:ATP-binding cassette domain-containing protein [Aliihoeflea aestuarii]|uniref:ABC transporter ATP-binding protein n=1 Tax=Aliihoeflea aestuarii TaxID=453840 RepID=UPI0020937720|nr:oligopeptide/dipeptide ABC transporter ATP-binding protein [Aliihoeflea aestuarii]MCO6390080.1 ATP-binding cassette domain-containing protein [Aliihoeflea aestuarii]
MTHRDDTDDVIVAANLEKHFPIRSGFLGRKVVASVRAVDGVSFRIRRGSCFAIVGESGSGKSTLARAVVGLIRPTGGEVLIDGESVSDKTDAQLRSMRRKVQLVLQDPLASLDPRMTVRQTLREALVVHRLRPDRAAREARIEEVVRQVGLSTVHLDRYPNALSGGQRQRVAIARAVVCEPEVLVLDEPVSALDVSVQAQIINLLMELQDRLHLTYVIITHDLSLVGYMADDVGVMYLGRFVERGPAYSVCRMPIHPYAESLLSAVAGVDPQIEKSKPLRILRGTAPSPTALPSGCTFHTRCPRARAIARTLAVDAIHDVEGEGLPKICVTTVPERRRCDPSDVEVTCHFACGDDGMVSVDSQNPEIRGRSPQ